MEARLDAFITFISTPHQVRGLRYARIGLGCILLYIYCINYAQRYFLFGPEGVLTDTTAFSLFHVGNVGVFDALYLMAISVAFCFVIGVGGRVVTFLNLIFFWSWTSVALLIGDGGDNILRIMLVYLTMVDLYGAISRRPKGLLQQILGVVHNIGLAAIIIQLCMLYLTAGLMKVQGAMWQDGTALYYILQVDEFRNPSIAALLTQHMTLLVLASYGTIFYQLAFPWLLLHPRTKFAAVGASVLFHVGIWFAMNLPSFSWIMIALELPLLSDSDYEVLGSWLKAVSNSLRQIRMDLPERSSVAEGRDG